MTANTIYRELQQHGAASHCAAQVRFPLYAPKLPSSPGDLEKCALLTMSSVQNRTPRTCDWKPGITRRIPLEIQSAKSGNGFATPHAYLAFYTIHNCGNRPHPRLTLCDHTGEHFPFSPQARAVNHPEARTWGKRPRICFAAFDFFTKSKATSGRVVNSSPIVSPTARPLFSRQHQGDHGEHHHADNARRYPGKGCKHIPARGGFDAVGFVPVHGCVPVLRRSASCRQHWNPSRVRRRLCRLPQVAVFSGLRGSGFLNKPGRRGRTKPPRRWPISAARAFEPVSGGSVGRQSLRLIAPSKFLPRCAPSSRGGRHCSNNSNLIFVEIHQGPLPKGGEGMRVPGSARWCALAHKAARLLGQREETPHQPPAPYSRGARKCAPHQFLQRRDASFGRAVQPTDQGTVARRRPGRSHSTSFRVSGNPNQSPTPGRACRLPPTQGARQSLLGRPGRGEPNAEGRAG